MQPFVPPSPPLASAQDMSLEQEREALALFRELLSCSTAEQQESLAKIADASPQVVALVQKMLAQEKRTDGNILSAIEAYFARTIPQQLGPFRLTELLGEGGMARVFKGVRAMDHREQYVAVKFIYAPLAPMPADAPRRSVLETLRARFLRERELLARMQHPALATLIDFGETPDGVLWYAMEFIDGLSIDAYCRQRALTLPDKLRLILELADVLSYAHSLGVIHRDIKPLNVLVSTDAKLHLIDFGIAKDIEEADLTQPGPQPMTPRFAAPEQLSGKTVTTATDQWQLAALSYCLLTDADFDARTSSTFKLVHRHAVPGFNLDVQAVLRRALRTQAADRYHSVAAFAQDLRAAMQGKAVQARAHESWYETYQFFKRYRLVLISIAAVIVTLLCASIFSYRAALRAEQQTRIAERTSALVSEIFLADETDPNLPQLNIGTLMAQGVDKVIAEKTLPVRARINLLTELAERTMESDQLEATERSAREALRLAENLQPKDALLTAECGLTLAGALLSSRRREQTAEEIERLIKTAFAIGEARDKSTAEVLVFAWKLKAFQAVYASDSTGAMDYAMHSRELAAQWLREEPLEVILAIRTQAAIARGLDRKADAIRFAQELIELGERYAKTLPKLQNQLTWDRANLCEDMTYVEPDAAIPVCQENLAALASAQQSESLTGFKNLSGLGRAYARLGRSAQALQEYQKAERVLLALEGENSQSLDLVSVRRRIGNRFIDLGRPAEALPALRFSASVARVRLSTDHPHTAEIHAELAQALARSGQRDEARAVLQHMNRALLGDVAREKALEVDALLSKR
jgi:serine/threonine protein kinase